MGEMADQLVEWEISNGYWREKKIDHVKRVKSLLKKRGIIKTIAIKKAIIAFCKDCNLEVKPWMTTDNDLYYFCRYISDKWWHVFKRYNDAKISNTGPK